MLLSMKSCNVLTGKTCRVFYQKRIYHFSLIVLIKKKKKKTCYITYEFGTNADDKEIGNQRMIQKTT